MTDAIFFALADSSRREILRRLSRRGPLPTGALTDIPGLTRQGASRHLAILEDSGLIRSKRRGRIVMREIDQKAIRGAQAWLDSLAEKWEARLESLAAQYED